MQRLGWAPTGSIDTQSPQSPAPNHRPTGVTGARSGELPCPGWRPQCFEQDTTKGDGSITGADQAAGKPMRPRVQLSNDGGS
jgi:hypothetical protein